MEFAFIRPAGAINPPPHSGGADFFDGYGYGPMRSPMTQASSSGDIQGKTQPGDGAAGEGREEATPSAQQPVNSASRDWGGSTKAFRVARPNASRDYGPGSPLVCSSRLDAILLRRIPAEKPPSWGQLGKLHFVVAKPPLRRRGGAAFQRFARRLSRIRSHHGLGGCRSFWTWIPIPVCATRTGLRMGLCRPIGEEQKRKTQPPLVG